MLEVTEFKPSSAAFGQKRIAVLLPCYNEAVTIAKVVADFQMSLPGAAVYVYDNNSSDGTGAIARAAGAVVRVEKRQGKGNVIRRMFADIDADIYVLADGDGTYSALFAPMLIDALISDELDFVNGSRVSTLSGAYRPGHQFGNRLLSGIVRWIFGPQFSDMLSGYKVLSRRFVKSFPAMSSGFETETELAVHALELRMPCAELPTPYSERPEGSVSKLNTVRDGARIILMIVKLIKEERPLMFFGLFGLVFFTIATVLMVPVLMTYLETGLVPRLPTAVLSLGMVLLGFLSIFTALILDMTTRARREIKRLIYLSVGRIL
ncbi:glycosyltransferase [Rhizobium sp. VS19-DR104.2]|uniref:glycosyltransferase n=1 Tax=unclassified Rhizobium TaxID=2613769 RepID=UPI001CC44FEF|nr:MULTISPECIES: glycosyltransferase [unclassified Rhizobium]MBZ5762812.1 glycosyltransferase [Rhizobium sp. VS19-DR96]MBZ5768037.1 glycosyltransferase [Rhizobium sp. VS19-DR129.2]MBZ5775593.1 glycosyltransferase [Rhizobium sp. VS19-DRK62.2]MBZ5787502.1 glycosyltransferase [Rhizobium sp. VS19-DR121]MBZ5803963.1 glycosyltransferase [Rhizobium sp. VS19-DR181]